MLDGKLKGGGHQGVGIGFANGGHVGYNDNTEEKGVAKNSVRYKSLAAQSTQKPCTSINFDLILLWSFD